MSYIWEFLKENNNLANFVVKESFCPYVEVFSDNPEEISVNPLLRFSEIFNALDQIFTGNHPTDELNEGNERDTLSREHQESFHCVILNYLAMLDKSFGLNYRQMLIEKVRLEVENNYFGEKVCSLYKDLKQPGINEQLSIKEQNIFLYLVASKLLKQDQSYFTEAVERLFSTHLLKFEESSSTYFLYIGERKTDYNSTKYELLKLMFWDRNLKLRTYWEYHYGIIGNNRTMLIGNMQIVGEIISREDN